MDGPSLMNKTMLFPSSVPLSPVTPPGYKIDLFYLLLYLYNEIFIINHFSLIIYKTLKSNCLTIIKPY